MPVDTPRGGRRYREKDDPVVAVLETQLQQWLHVQPSATDNCLTDSER